MNIKNGTVRAMFNILRTFFFLLLRTPAGGCAPDFFFPTEGNGFHVSDWPRITQVSNACTRPTRHRNAKPEQQVDRSTFPIDGAVPPMATMRNLAGDSSLFSL